MRNNNNNKRRNSDVEKSALLLYWIDIALTSFSIISQICERKDL